MELDLAEMHAWIVAELARRRPIAESMTALIDRCDAECPHPDWAAFRELPFGDVSPLLDWVQTPFRDEPPEAPLKGLWFGLFNPCPDGRTPVADIYVCGSERFEPDPDDNSWAVGPDWWPEFRYARSGVLAQIYRIAYRQGQTTAEREECLENNAEYPLCLGYGAFAVRELLAQVEPSLLLGPSESIGVAVGFDSGDFVLLGTLTSDGLTPISPDAGPPQLPLESILEALRCDDSNVAVRAIFELVRLGASAKAAIPELLRVMRSSKEPAMRQAVVMQLATIASDDPRAKAATLDALSDSSPSVRREALQALISFQELSAADLRRIKNMENDSDARVADWSAIALRNIALRGDTTESGEWAARPET